MNSSHALVFEVLREAGSAGRVVHAMIYWIDQVAVVGGLLDWLILEMLVVTLLVIETTMDK